MSREITLELIDQAHAYLQERALEEGISEGTLASFAIGLLAGFRQHLLQGAAGVILFESGAGLTVTNTTGVRLLIAGLSQQEVDKVAEVATDIRMISTDRFTPDGPDPPPLRLV